MNLHYLLLLPLLLPAAYCATCKNCGGADKTSAKRLKMPNKSVFTRLAGIELLDVYEITNQIDHEACAQMCDAHHVCAVFEFILANKLCVLASAYARVADDLADGAFETIVFVKVRGKFTKAFPKDKETCLDKSEYEDYVKHDVEKWINPTPRSTSSSSSTQTKESGAAQTSTPSTSSTPAGATTGTSSAATNSKADATSSTSSSGGTTTTPTTSTSATTATEATVTSTAALSTSASTPTRSDSSAISTTVAKKDEGEGKGSSSTQSPSITQEGTTTQQLETSTEDDEDPSTEPSPTSEEPSTTAASDGEKVPATTASKEDYVDSTTGQEPTTAMSLAGRWRISTYSGSSFLRAVDWTVLISQKFDEWTQWEIETGGSDKDQITFKSMQGRFLSGDSWGLVNLAWGAGPWEQWTAVNNADGTWSFKSTHGKWLSAKDGELKQSLESGESASFILQKWY